MLQINSEMFAQIMERFDKIERTLERMNKLKDCLDGDTLLTYYMIDGRTYYKASEVEAFLNQKGKSLPTRFRHQTNV